MALLGGGLTSFWWAGPASRILSESQLATLRSHDGVLVLETMLWPDEVRDSEFAVPGDDVDVRKQEVAMAESYIATLKADFDPDRYHSDYREELEETAAAHPGWLKYVPTISRPWEDPAWPGERGRVDDLLRKYSDSLDLQPGETTAYLCGNPGMIVNARDILRRRGYQQTDIKEETYWAPGEGEVEY